MKKTSKFLSFIISLVILFSSIPTFTYAELYNDALDSSQSVESSKDENTDSFESQENVCQDSQLAKGSYLYETNYDQTKINYKNVTVDIPNLKRIINLDKADSVVIKGNMSYNGTTVQSFSKKIKLSDIKDNSFEINFPTYGKFSVQAIYYKNDKVVTNGNTSTVGVVAEEYNLAALNATFPVVQFTLSLWDMKDNSNNEPVPTFVALTRSDAYNWNNIPENVYEVPFLTNRDNTSFQSKINMMSQYVKDLYELNPDSKFNLYTVDYTIKTFLTVIIQNNIPSNQYSLRVLSDGTASYADFNKIFNVSNPQNVYNSMAKEWAYVKEQYSKGNYIDLSKLEYAYAGNSNSLLRYYAYVIVNEESKNDTQWWLSRVNDTFNISDTNFLNQAKNCPAIKITNISSMLTNLQTKGDNVINELKTLYHFNDTMFSEATQKNKKVMMILGTRVNLESNFSDYTKFLKTYYGDDYIYYYKGHPSTPTNLYESKQKELSELGVTDIESSIAAELILFFYPDISMSGYSSTTFMSASADTACGLFGRTRASASSESYSSLLDFYISPLTDYSSELGKLAKQNHTNYMVEFQDKDKYDVAIWDATDGSITYYKLKYGKYIYVSKTITTAPNVTADSGRNQITLNWNKVAGATKYRVYSYDESTKKYTKITDTTKTSYTISNLKDGTKYTYLVRAYDGSSWSNYTSSNNISAVTFCAAPNATAKGGNKSITLSWKYVKGALRYRIYSFNKETGTYTKIADTTDLKYTVSNLSNGTEYTYLVKAYNGTYYNYHTRSKNNISCSTLCASPRTISNDGQNQITISWSKVTGATKYRIYSYNQKTNKITKIADTTGTKYTVKKLSSGTEYTYLVRAYNGNSWSSYTLDDVVSSRTYCSSPKVTAKGGSKNIALSWKSVKGASKYRIYKYNTSTKKYTSIGTTTGTKYTVSGLSKGKKYTYLVRAYNGMSYNSYTSKNNVSATVK
ncbi:fibronectin type III domain-containing protein [Terrisporobacter hibernicus]|uniref:Fibronectin type III domain-containing protein n=1 Tax=Terrisporobacter hibernicus TaxID=2813371 RepID=A0AAX2ZI86_9FIRM|nr:fibronectin type III domain-containing protein [Terrisporobacter hibernicus]UEL48505.1 fibronectin type III domain-containing protein [Terrisporobacter hibernicus]